jgi:hypothetical protein
MINNDNYELAEEDAALVIKPDMTTELVIPKMDDDAAIKFEENQNVFICLAIGACMSDPDFRKIIQAKLSCMFETVEPGDGSVTDQEDPGGTSGSTDDEQEDPSCGGCKGCG